MAFCAFSTAYLFPRSFPLIRMWGRTHVSSQNGSPERRYLAKWSMVNQWLLAFNVIGTAYSEMQSVTSVRVHVASADAHYAGVVRPV
jgi:hypothetical protein